MLELHGRRKSNYFNAAKAILIEKNIAFEEVIEPLPPTDAFKALSPALKIPLLVTEHGPITETLAIVDYLEDIHPEPALAPKDAFARAKLREIARSMELYIELEARRGYGVFRGAEVPPSVGTAMKEGLEKYAPAIAQHTDFSPWIAGDTFTYGDIYGYFMLQYAVPAADKVAGVDLLAALPGAQAWLKRVAERASMQRVLDEAAEG
ncbi:MAG: glutathione S-transferase family protein [Gammaproteobacteria bacterium]|nr:glutathione S-transferase family protein [Gammaproteobacteria bacterium]